MDMLETKGIAQAGHRQRRDAKEGIRIKGRHKSGWANVLGGTLVFRVR